MSKVTLSEKDIEDYLSKNCEALLGLKFIESQHHLGIGIIDIIAQHPTQENVRYVVEIKRNVLDPYAYAQVLKHTNHINSLGGEHTYLPLLVGASLHHGLNHLCMPLDIVAYEQAIDLLHVPSYKCLDFYSMPILQVPYKKSKKYDISPVQIVIPKKDKDAAAVVEKLQKIASEEGRSISSMSWLIFKQAVMER